jgi:hypothetical protein
MVVVEAILSPPATPGFKRMSMFGTSVVASMQSPFTGTQQVLKWPGEWWEAQVSLPPMNRAQAEEWIAFLLNCRGGFRRMKLGDPSGRVPRGVATGAPVIDGAGQGGNLLSLRGFTPNVAGILLAGDYIEVADHLYKVTYPEDTDGNGAATFDIFPALRNSPADGDPVILVNTAGTFRLASNKTQWSIDEAKIFGIDFTALEAF